MKKKNYLLYFLSFSIFISLYFTTIKFENTSFINQKKLLLIVFSKHTPYYFFISLKHNNVILKVSNSTIIILNIIDIFFKIQCV